MTQSARNQPSTQTNLAKCRLSRWNGSPAFKIELLWRPNGEKASLLLPRLSPVNSSLFLLENRGNVARNATIMAGYNLTKNILFDTVP